MFFEKIKFKINMFRSERTEQQENFCHSGLPMMAKHDKNNEIHC